MKENIKRYLIGFLILISICVVPIVVFATQASTEGNISAECETSMLGVKIKIRSNIDIKYLKIYRKAENGNYILFYKGKEGNVKEKDLFFSRNILPDNVNIKIVALDKDDNTHEGDIEVEIPPMPSINPEETAEPSWEPPVIPTKPTPSVNPSEQPGPSGSDTITGIKLNKNSVTLKVGQKDKLTYTVTPEGAHPHLKWRTDANEICSIEADGTITGVSVGEATISIKADNGVMDICMVSVVASDSGETGPSPSGDTPAPSYAPPSTGTGSNETIRYGDDTYVVPSGDKVFFFDVSDKEGSGYRGSDCMLICSNGKFGLVDATLSYRGKRVVQHLKELGIQELEFIIISHNHGDHVGGYSKIAGSFPIKKMYVKKKYNNIVGTANKHNTEIILGDDCKPFVFENFTISFYSTKNVRANNENVNCLTAVAEQTSTGKRIYFAGDIQNDSDRGNYPEREAAKAVGQVDVYKVGHHCYSAQNNSQQAINHLKPFSAVATNHSKRSGTASAYNRIKEYTGVNKFFWTGCGTVLLNINSDGVISYKQFAEEK